jgi:hypothetical protein
MVSEISVHGGLSLLLWASGSMIHHDKNEASIIIISKPAKDTTKEENKGWGHGSSGRVLCLDPVFEIPYHQKYF